MKSSSIFINDENPIFSLATCLVLAWKTLAKIQNRVIDNTSVAFKYIKFQKCLPKIEESRLEFTVLPNSGNFEVYFMKELIVDGNMKITDDVHAKKITLPTKSISNQLLKDDDIYKELTRRGYCHTDSTKCIYSTDLNADVGYITWKDWPSFLSAVLEFDLLKKDTKHLYIPKIIESIVIDANTHTVVSYSSPHVAIFNHKNIGVIAAGGVQISDVKYSLIPQVVEVDFEMYANEMNKKVDEVKKQLKDVRLISSSIGKLSSLRWIENPRVMVPPGSDMEICHVYYSSLNHQDYSFASERELSDDLYYDLENRPLGIEFSGLTTTGKRVMGIVQNGLATSVIADKRLLWDVPDNWSLEQAASVPVAFCNAYYALFVRGQMKPNQLIVIYDGSSDIGYAAIRLALHYGCEVFSTYETRSQRTFICSRFLLAKDKMNSQHWDPTFEKKVIEYTNGKGADIILNLLGSEKLPAALSCLAKDGKLLNLGRDNNFNKNLLILESNQSIQSIDMNNVSDADKLIVSDLLTEGIRNGDVYPLNLACYTSAQIVEAFKNFGAVDRIEKIIVCIRKEDTPIDKISDATILGFPQTYMDMNKTYILIGGPEEVVTHCCFWLISRGATKLVLVQERNVSNYQLWCIKRWKHRGIDVIISKQDVTTREGVKLLLKDTTTGLGDVDGIFDLSTLYLEDNEPKDDDGKMVIKGIQTMEEVTREMAPNLTYFVILTSKSNQAMRRSLINIVQNRKRTQMPGIVVHMESESQDSNNLKSSNERISVDTSLDCSIKCIIQDLDKVLVQPYDIVTVISK